MYSIGAFRADDMRAVHRVVFGGTEASIEYRISRFAALTARPAILLEVVQVALFLAAEVFVGHTGGCSAVGAHAVATSPAIVRGISAVGGIAVLPMATPVLSIVPITHGYFLRKIKAMRKIG